MAFSVSSSVRPARLSEQTATRSRPVVRRAAAASADRDLSQAGKSGSTLINLKAITSGLSLSAAAVIATHAGHANAATELAHIASAGLDASSLVTGAGVGAIASALGVSYSSLSKRIQQIEKGSAPASALAPVTKEEVLAVQNAWAGAIQNISKIYLDGGDYVSAAAKAAGELYAYGHSNVLFKPTKAAEYQFRPTPEEAMSYFVGCKAVEGGYEEDGGFAINGGNGFSSCVYDNHKIELVGGVGIAMGNYVFTCATTGEESKVEYTFGYRRCEDGKVRIFLHHSSVPFQAPVPATV
mmetsp:Transcript_26402/g.74304  ORF Transcript_26402/g.74304 Transcript_26402/m.74304 type:complete len:297 (+) Transcript_26402:92-982(+)